MEEIHPQSLHTIYSTLILSSTPIQLPSIFQWLPNFCLQSVLVCRPTCSTNYLISPFRSFKAILNSTSPKTEVTIPLNQALLWRISFQWMTLLSIQVHKPHTGFILGYFFSFTLHIQAIKSYFYSKKLSQICHISPLFSILCLHHSTALDYSTVVTYSLDYHNSLLTIVTIDQLLAPSNLFCSRLSNMQNANLTLSSPYLNNLYNFLLHLF